MQCRCDHNLELHSMASTLISPKVNSIPTNQHLLPIPDGLSTELVQTAIDECATRGGGTVILGLGRYYCGTIVLRSNITLHLEAGAEIVASVDINHFIRRDGVVMALIYAEGVQNIAITGKGTIDGNAIRFKKPTPDWVERKKGYGTYIPASDSGIMGERLLATVVLADCRNVLMEDVRVVNSPRWTILPIGCDGVTMRRLAIRSPADACNGDGIDLDGCQNALIEDCDIETGDDCVCLKCTGQLGLQRPTRKIVVRRCNLRSTCHGFCIGHETQDDFEDVLVEDCTISGFGGHRVSTGFAIGMIDGAAIRNIRIRNITMTHVVSPMHIRLSNEGRNFRGLRTRSQEFGTIYIDMESRKRRQIGSIVEIAILDLRVRDASGNSIISGLPGHALRGISLTNVHVEFTGTLDPSLFLQEVPEIVGEYPSDPIWTCLPAYGFYCRHISGLSMEAVDIQTDVPESRPAVMKVDVV